MGVAHRRDLVGARGRRPLQGVGEGNYAFGYYEQRKTDRNLTDPHSLPVRLLAETGTRVAHNASAVFSIRGRCPAPELIDMGVLVMLSTDATAPDRSADQFRNMWQCMNYHRRHFRDENVMPPGKVLEMVTIDAARALGMDDRIGSIEPGKAADLILGNTPLAAEPFPWYRHGAGSPLHPPGDSRNQQEVRR